MGEENYERARLVININCGLSNSILQYGMHVFFQDDRPRNPQPADKSKRRCDRCGRTYSVDEDGLQTNEEECVYHWGRKYRMRGSRATGPVHQYSCCSATADADGCQVSSCHFAEMQGTSTMWAWSVQQILQNLVVSDYVLVANLTSLEWNGSTASFYYSTQWNLFLQKLSYSVYSLKGRGCGV